MTDKLTTATDRLDELTRKARDFLKADVDDAKQRFVSGRVWRANTATAYADDWNDYLKYLAEFNFKLDDADPEDLLIGYVVSRQDTHKLSTIRRRVTGILQTYRIDYGINVQQSETVNRILSGLQRQRGTRTERKKPLILRYLVQLLDHCDDDLLGRRNRALLVTGYAGAFRQSELVSLNVQDLRLEDSTVTLQGSKTTAEATDVYLEPCHVAAFCPLNSLRSWLAASKITTGPVFRGFTPRGDVRETGLIPVRVWEIVKMLAKRAGMNPADFGGHSLRAGRATQLAIDGRPHYEIKDNLRHAEGSLEYEGYIRQAKVYRDWTTKRVLQELQ